MLFCVIWFIVNNLGVSYKKPVVQSTELEERQVNWLYQKCKVIVFNGALNEMCKYTRTYPLTTEVQNFK